MVRTFYRLQMKEGKDGKTIAEDMLAQNIITADEKTATSEYAELKANSIVLVHKGAYPIALVRIIRKLNDDELSEYSLGFDYSVKILSWYKDAIIENKNLDTLWGTTPHSRTFSPVYSGNETYERINNWYEHVRNKHQMTELTQLLKAKKQLILQGPPGTGKTRMARELARKIISENALLQVSEEEIRNTITSGMRLKTPENERSFQILFFTDKGIKVKPDRSELEYSVSFEEIKKCFADSMVDKTSSENNQSGNGSYKVSISRYLKDKLLESHYRLVQFHPSYSYEDFVRGVTAKSTGNGIEYGAENKILADIAAEAHKNYTDSSKAPVELTREANARKIFEEFAEDIANQLLPNRDFTLNDTVSVLAVEEDAFRYSGETWKNDFRMKFEDLISMFVRGVKTRKEIKKLSYVSGLARTHATYFKFMLDKLYEFAQDKDLSSGQSIKVDLKNYVLIIDEINRANLSSVLGELIYALEYRGQAVESMYELDGKREIILPPNLYIIGTMNTADRSVGHIDYAIRRRFAFVDVLPTKEPINKNALPLFKQISELFIENFDEINWADPQPVRSTYLAPDFRPEDVWIGHSYFLTQEEDADKAKEELEQKLKYEIKPILKEYIKDGVLLPEAEETINQLHA